jgi:prepilin-type N-terminal cleavage/methylation domain-containing protein
MSSSRDDGFTLIEVIVSVAILVVILAALTAALITFYKVGSDTARRDDHNAGAALVGSYLDRDLAASTDVVSPAGTTCSGQANVFAVKWSDYTATAANPSPAPGSSYVVAYALMPDTVTAVPGLGARKQLERWMCRDGSQVDHEVLIGDVASGDFATGSSTACGTGLNNPVTRVSLVLNRFENDSSSGVLPYNYAGCVGSRQQ